MYCMLKCWITSYHQFLHAMLGIALWLRMGPHSATEYIDRLQKYLANCANVSETQAKFIFEMNLAN